MHTLFIFLLDLTGGTSFFPSTICNNIYLIDENINKVNLNLILNLDFD